MNVFLRTPTYHIHLQSAEQLSGTADDSVQFVFAAPPLFDHLSYGEAAQDISSVPNYDRYLQKLGQVFAECYRVLQVGRCMSVLALDSYELSPSGEIESLTTSSHDLLRVAKEAGFSLVLEQYLETRPRKSRVYLPTDTNLHRRSDGKLIPRYQKLYVLTKGAAVDRPPFIKDALVNGYWKPAHTVRLPTTLLGSRALYSLATKLIRPLRHSPRTVVQNWYDTVRYWLLREGRGAYPGYTDRLLVQDLIKLYSQPGETVLDPFLGSGTTLFACIKLGRSCTGYEINPAVRPLVESQLAPEITVKWLDTLSTNYTKG